MVTVAKEAEEEDFVDEQTQSELGGHSDWQLVELPLAFCEDRHLQKIESSKTVTQTWRMKERVIQGVDIGETHNKWLGSNASDLVILYVSYVRLTL